jgi:8-oxo-dGTP diphosphatase
MSIGRFFAGISALVRRPSDGKYLVLRRSEDKDFGSGAWECITGRVDQGERFEDAVHREALEELGIEVRTELFLGTMRFYRGEARPENEMVGVQFCCSAEKPEALRLSWEHSECRWVTAAEAEALLPVGHWLRQTIERAEMIRALSPAELLQYYRDEIFG